MTDHKNGHSYNYTLYIYTVVYKIRTDIMAIEHDLTTFVIYLNKEKPGTVTYSLKMKKRIWAQL